MSLTPEEARARLGALLRGLSAFTQHHHSCESLVVLTSLPPKTRPCSCGLADALAACGDLDAVLAALRSGEPDTAHEVYMERCRAMFVIEQAFGCRRIEDEPCSCAACVVREKIMGVDPPAGARVPPGETTKGGG